MNKAKLFGILVASVGVAASFASAYALYTKDVNPVHFDIGDAAGYTSEGEINYTIGGQHGKNLAIAPRFLGGEQVATAFDPDHRGLQYDFALSATFGEGVTPQEYIAGNIAVEFKSINSALFGKMKFSMWIDGYNYYDADQNHGAEPSYGMDAYGGQLYSGETRLEDVVIDAASYTVDARDIVVRTGSENLQSLHVYIGLLDEDSEHNAIDPMDFNELTNLWSLKVTWGEASGSFEKAYVGNNKTGWVDYDDFVMVPNIDCRKSEGKQWTATVVGSEQLTEAKCHLGEAWEKDGDSEIANHPLTSGHTYKIYWWGAGRVAEFYDPSATPNS